MNKTKINTNKEALEKEYEMKKIKHYKKIIHQEYNEIERLLLISETSEKKRKMTVKKRFRIRMFLSIVLILLSVGVIVVVEVNSLLSSFEPLGAFLYLTIMLYISGFLTIFNMKSLDKDTTINYPNDRWILLSIESSENKIKSYRNKISNSKKKLKIQLNK